MDDIEGKKQRLSYLSERLEALRRFNKSLDKFRTQFERECKEQGIEQCPKSK